MPEVECTLQEITVWFSTLKAFRGKVFIVGYTNDSECVARHTGIKTTFIHIKRNSCGMALERELFGDNLKLSVKVTVSFNPFFVTKQDRSYQITCRFKSVKSKKTKKISGNNNIPTLKIVNGLLPCTYKVINRTSTANQYIWKCPQPSNVDVCLRLTNCKIKKAETKQLLGTIDSSGCASEKKYSLDYSEIDSLKITKILSKKVVIEDCKLELHKKLHYICMVC
uniref:ZP domain-containing protein n=1 Tax=Parastrongyloides trichosuri TaxID=131310 RepID=A0A0N5A1N8_PARTI